MADETKYYRVCGLSINNFLGVKAVEITPDPGSNVISIEGANEAGKTSIVDGMMAAITGNIPDNPIHGDAKKANCTVDLGDIVVELRITEKGKKLFVRSREGMEYNSPQSVLNKLFQTVTIDPLKFMDLKPKDRWDYLLEATGKGEEIELIDHNHKVLFDNRTGVNRTVKELANKLFGAPEGEDGEEISIADLSQEISFLNDQEYERKTVEAQLTLLKDHLSDVEARIVDLEADAKDKRERIAAVEKNLAGNAPLGEKIVALEKAIATAEDTNADIRAIHAANILRGELEKGQLESTDLTKKMAELGAQKDDILKKSKLPVKGLAFDGNSLVIDGIPFDSMAMSAKLKISMMIAAALNPTLRIMRIGRGNDLDTKSMKQLKSFAKSNNYQVWLEYVADEPQNRGEQSFFITDGSIDDTEA